MRALAPSGDVNTGAAVVWPRLDAAQERLLSIDVDIVQSTWFSATCDFWVRANRNDAKGGHRGTRRALVDEDKGRAHMDEGHGAHVDEGKGRAHMDEREG